MGKKSKNEMETGLADTQVFLNMNGPSLDAVRSVAPSLFGYRNKILIWETAHIRQSQF